MSEVTLWRKSTWHDRLVTTQCNYIEFHVSDIVTCMKIGKRKSEGKDELLHNALKVYSIIPRYTGM